MSNQVSLARTVWKCADVDIRAWLSSCLSLKTLFLGEVKMLHSLVIAPFACSSRIKWFLQPLIILMDFKKVTSKTSSWNVQTPARETPMIVWSLWKTAWPLLLSHERLHLKFLWQRCKELKDTKRRIKTGSVLNVGIHFVPQRGAQCFIAAEQCIWILHNAIEQT